MLSETAILSRPPKDVFGQRDSRAGDRLGVQASYVPEMLILPFTLPYFVEGCPLNVERWLQPSDTQILAGLYRQLPSMCWNKSLLEPLGSHIWQTQIAYVHEKLLPRILPISWQLLVKLRLATPGFHHSVTAPQNHYSQTLYIKSEFLSLSFIEQSLINR